MIYVSRGRNLRGGVGSRVWMWERGLYSCRYKTYIPACIIEAVCILCVGEGVFGTCRNKTFIPTCIWEAVCAFMRVYVGGGL